MPADLSASKGCMKGILTESDQFIMSLLNKPSRRSLEYIYTPNNLDTIYFLYEYKQPEVCENIKTVVCDMTNASPNHMFVPLDAEYINTRISFHKLIAFLKFYAMFDTKKITYKIYIPMEPHYMRVLRYIFREVYFCGTYFICKRLITHCVVDLHLLQNR